MKPFSQLLSSGKEHWWLLGIWWITYQFLFLIVNNAINLFSWSQIPADTISFTFFIVITGVFWLPWAPYDDSIFKKWYSILLRLVFSGLIYIVIRFVSSTIDNTLITAITNLLFLSIWWGILVELKNMLGTRFPENNRYIMFIVLFIYSFIFLWNAIYWSISIKNNDKIIPIHYMNDRYIILKDWQIIRNTESVVLIKSGTKSDK